MIVVGFKKRFPNVEIDISLRFGSEFVILTGSNGSGKTTVLRAVAGLERPDEGHISVSDDMLFDGVRDIPPDKRGIGYVFQDPALFPWLSVEENVRFGLKNSGVKVDMEWLSLLYEELEIAHLLSRYPTNLSGGEAERVALARALATKPRLLLLDEPFSAVDMDLRPRLRSFVADLQKKWDIAVLMVTHDHTEIHTLADRVFRLEGGKVVETTKRGELRGAPLISY